MLTSTAPSVVDMLREKSPEEAILQLLRRRISLSHSSRSNDWVWRVKVWRVRMWRRGEDRVRMIMASNFYHFLYLHTLTPSHTHTLPYSPWRQPSQHQSVWRLAFVAWYYWTGRTSHGLSVVPPSLLVPRGNDVRDHQQRRRRRWKWE